VRGISIFDPATEKYVSLATYRRNGVEVKTLLRQQFDLLRQ